MTCQSGIYEGYVRHRRFEPVRHDFRMPIFMMYLDLEELPSLFRKRWFWSIEKWNLATFRRCHHVGDSRSSLDETIRNLVTSQTGRRPNGPIRLLTHLSYFGYCFNPISLFFCFDDDGNRLHTVVAEVTNTPWNERHCYILPVTNEFAGSSFESSNKSKGLSRHNFQFAKAFHVSPFMGMDVEYRWNMRGPHQRFILHTENRKDGRPLFDATLSLRRREITSTSLARMLCFYPVMTARVLINVYWQALRLWLKQVPYYPHPKTCQTNSQVKNNGPHASP